MRQGSAMKSNPLPSIYQVWQKRNSIRIPSIDKWFPFLKPGLELYIPLNCFKCIVYKLRIKLQNQKVFSQKMHPFVFLGLLIGQMTDFPTLSYTPTRGVDRAVLMPLYSSNIPSMSNLPCMFSHSTVFHYKNLSLKLKKAVKARRGVSNTSTTGSNKKATVSGCRSKRFVFDTLSTNLMSQKKHRTK